MSLGEKIRNARIAKKLSQKDLADAISDENETYGNTTISNWENNINKPDPDVIAKLCITLDVDANYLLNFEEIKKEKAQSRGNTKLIEQYKILFDKDNALTNDQKNFMINFIQEQHEKIDKDMDN